MADPPSTKVLLADKPGFGRTALAGLLKDTPGITLVGKLGKRDLIKPAIEETRPDVLVIDDRLLRDDRWTGGDLGVRLIVVGVDDDPGFATRARHIGAEEWVPKDQADAILPLLLMPREPVSR
jgi:DNA-binding NarL/FixJ family response regulator